MPYCKLWSNLIVSISFKEFLWLQSIEKLVIDNEIVGMVKRLLRGVEDHGTPFASEILKDYNEKEELLSHPTTLKLFRKELFIVSPVIDRMSRDAWKENGSKSTRKRAKEQASKLINKGPLKPIDDNLIKELEIITLKNLKSLK